MAETSENTVKKQKPQHLWKPGQSGNPAGKPKGAKHLSTLLSEAIKKVANDKGETEDVLIIKSLLSKAKSGSEKAIDMIFDRTEGKVDQGVNLGTLSITFDTTFKQKNAIAPGTTEDRTQ